MQPVRADMPERAPVHASTHVGYLRAHNEDRCRTPDWQTSGEDEDWRGTTDRVGGWVLIADGMGGHGAGEVASEVAVETLATRIPRSADDQELVAAILDANGSVHDAMTIGVGRPGMGTTIVGAVLARDSCTFFNVGDSRAYLFRGHRLTRHTIDHTPGAGGSRGPRSHALTQSLGGTLTRRRLEPHVKRVPIRPGDIIVLCSDGLTDLVDEEAITLLLGSGPIHPAAALVKAALAAGGRDNVTVATISL